MKELEKNCEYYRVSAWNLKRRYCSNPSEELKKIKEQKGLVKKINKMIDYGTCIGFEECSFKEVLKEE